MKKNQESYFLLKKILGFSPHNLELYKLALRHKSLSVTREDGVKLNNERLEFLGDAVLDLLVADLVFHHFDKEKEGFLTTTRSKIVQRKMLNQIALELGFEGLVLCADGTVSPRQTIYGNTLEAVVGAVYLDRGYRFCQRFIEKKILERFINIEEIAHEEVNFKSRLIEWSQRMKRPVDFKTLQCSDSENPKSAPEFCCEIWMSKKMIATAKSYSKKSAQQAAARIALESISASSQE